MNLIDKIGFRVVHRPLRTLFATALGSKTVATSVLVSVQLSQGQAALGEVPTSFVLPHETVGAIQAILREARTAFVGRPIDEYEALLGTFRRQHEAFHMTLSGLEVALFRAHLADRGESEFTFWGGRRKSIETDITIPYIPQPRMLKSWMGRIAKVGFRHYKVKVSGQVDADMKFVQAVRDTLRRQEVDFVIRLDGNQGYTAKSYDRMLGRLEKAGIEIELFEQPLKKDDFAGLRQLRTPHPVPMVLDETVFDSRACRRVIEENLAQGVNIKIAKSGIAESAKIYRAARQAHLKLMIGCMTETMAGLSAGIFLAAGTGNFDYIDLDSIHLMSHANRYGPIAISANRYVLEEQ